jgi:selenocysteine-specific elongation factor
MVAGSCGIDFVLMVIAADSGIMPQTREHMQILEMLKISHGIIALTKTDLVDGEILELAQEEIYDFTRGTFLENSTVIPVSSATGNGIDELKETIIKYMDTIPQRPRGGIFRLFIDRIFTVSGFGTVVTGTVISGILRTGDTIYLLPVEKKLRVRRLEKHIAEVDKVVAGDRVAINVAGLNREDFRRGMILSDSLMRGTGMVDAKLVLFKHIREIKIWTDAIFLLGTYELRVRIHLLSGNAAYGGDSVLVQIHLPYECNISVHDRFIIRSTSRDVTLGGGEVIDASPLHHRRRPEKLIKNLQTIADGPLEGLVAHEVRKRNKILNNTELSKILNISNNKLMSMSCAAIPPDIISYREDDTILFLTEKEDRRYKELVRRSIRMYHKNNPVSERGQTIRELLGIVGLNNVRNGNEYLTLVLRNFAAENKLKQVDNTWAIYNHKITVTTEIQGMVNLLDDFFQKFKIKIATNSEIEIFLKKHNIIPKNFKQVIAYLLYKKRIYSIEGDYIHADTVDPVRIKLLKALKEQPKGLTVAQFRDLVSGNRKICLSLYSLYDKEEFTQRNGDVRVITEKGRRFISSFT